VFSSGGCPGGKETLHRAKQDQVKDWLQAEEPSSSLVWIIIHAAALLHPSKVQSSSRAGCIHEESQAVRMSLASEHGDRALQNTSQAAAQGHQQSWAEPRPRLLQSTGLLPPPCTHAPQDCAAVGGRSLDYNTPDAVTIPSQGVLSPPCFYRVGGQPQDAWRMAAV